jgi:hypothetical protein
VNAVATVVVHSVVANHRPVAAIGNVDAVFNGRTKRGVVFDQEIVDETGENAPVTVVVRRDIADRDVRGERGAVHTDGSYTGPLHTSHVKAIDDDVRGVFEIDAVLCANRVRLVNKDAGLGEKCDGRRGAAIGRQVEPGVVPRADGDVIAGAHVFGRVLKRSPGLRCRAGRRVVSGR